MNAIQKLKEEIMHIVDEFRPGISESIIDDIAMSLLKAIESYATEQEKEVERLQARTKELEELWQKIVDICNEGKVLSFEGDWGGNTLTISIDKAHTHVGVPDGDLQTLIRHLHGLLCLNYGLSWHRGGEL